MEEESPRDKLLLLHLHTSSTTNGISEFANFTQFNNKQRSCTIPHPFEKPTRSTEPSLRPNFARPKCTSAGNSPRDSPKMEFSNKLNQQLKKAMSAQKMPRSPQIDPKSTARLRAERILLNKFKKHVPTVVLLQSAIRVFLTKEQCRKFGKKKKNNNLSHIHNIFLTIHF